VTGCRENMRSTLVCAGSNPWATTLQQRSRSVMTPASLRDDWSSTTGMEPILVAQHGGNFLCVVLRRATNRLRRHDVSNFHLTSFFSSPIFACCRCQAVFFTTSLSTILRFPAYG